MRRRKLLSLLMFSASLLMGYGCSNASSNTDQTGSRGMTRVAAVQFEAPFVYQQGQRMVGAEVGIVDRAMAKLNQSLEAQGGRASELLWAKREYPTLLPSVEGLQIEMAVGVVAVTEETRRMVDFSDSYYTSELVFVMNPSYKRLKSDQLAGQRVGVRESTSVESWVRQNYPDSETVPFNSLNEALLALRRAEIEGVIDDRNMAAYSLDSVTGVKHLEIVPGVLGTLDVAVALPKGNQTLLAAVNEAVAEIKSSGEFQEWLSNEMGDRVAQVERRYTDRVRAEERARKPRSLNLRVMRDNGSQFDIYRTANLRFSLRNNKSGDSLQTSKVSFSGRIGSVAASMAPGSYTLYLPDLFGNTPLGEILIKEDDPDRVSYDLRWKADDTLSLLAATN